jgi:DNA repair protein REV1
METKKRKLNEQFVHSDSLNESLTPVSCIFDGVTIYVNGYTDPCADDLKRLMKLHGGQYAYFYSKSQVTHMIANNLPDTKIKDLSKTEKVVQPKWITDSVKAGMLLPYQNYLLYSSTSRSQPKIPFPTTAPVSKLETVKSNAGPLSVEQQEEAYESDKALTSSDCNIPTPQLPDTEPLSLECAQSHDFYLVPKLLVSETAKNKTIPKTNEATFVKEFYNNSRLHFLSTWGTEFRDYMANLYAQRRGGQQSVHRQYDQSQRTIMHIDMDCFFVSVSIRDKPWLRGKPVGVCHAQNRSNKSEKVESGKSGEHDVDKTMESAEAEARLEAEPWWKLDGPHQDKVSHAEIASCSYEARQAGVKNGMFLGKAQQLCPDLQLVPYEFEKYRATSQVLYDTLASHTLEIEAVSCDEAYMDVTHIVCEGQDPCKFAEELRREIYDKTSCNASIGIGPNILLARMATRKAKPNGQFLLTKMSASEFMKRRPVSDLPGVGYSTKTKLEGLNVNLCGDLQAKPLSWLQSEFGPKTGRSLYHNCRGIDDRPLKIVRERKSLSAEINYGIRFKQESDADEFMKNLGVEVQSRLNAACVKGKQITLKVKVRADDAPLEPVKYMGHGVCNNLSRSVVLASATDSCSVISQESLKLLKQLKVTVQDIRGMGIQISKLVPTRQGPSVFPTGRHSRMQQNITSFTCSSRELDDRELPSIQSGNHTGSRVPCVATAKNIAQGQEMTSVSSVPPLPLLPTVSQPNSKEWFDSVGICEKRNEVASDIHDSSLDLPPLSQVDKSVLEALPEDMLEHIKYTYRRREKTDHGHVASRPTRASSVQHGPTGKQAVTLQSLPPFSEIDPEYLSALPAEMQAEILNAYSTSSSTQASATNKRSKTLSNVSSHKGKSKLLESMVSVSPKGKSSCSKPEGRKSNSLTSTTVPSSRIPLRQPTLLGTYELADVRSVVKEWIGSTNDPEEVDIVEFQDYLDKLFDEWNLDMIIVLLKCFRRQALAKSMWCKVYNRVLTVVQQKVKTKYGGHLQLSFINKDKIETNAINDTK